ncbi:PAS domain-containing protein (plasmid) [Lichenicola cladoniae]|uniref:histidine kinase n=1 Tax=Lichenicola cladoniae TaxID=1484109 RepID=A0A6M8HY58_9PROT|nr:PAS domain-containing sensor histidine kinase [Lichenicola cladoniae]NPD66815.1 PAS domain-containing protein [Acetobacteraceae bacterium]QKE93489.1 PAS domain-containing protein [Lichenicola cladoniae]
MRQFENPEDAQTLALALVEAIPEPFVILDDKFCVVAANDPFYDTFQVDPTRAHGITLYDLDKPQWDIPDLHRFLETVVSQHTQISGIEVERDVPGLGRRVMLMSARKVDYARTTNSNTLLAFQDITERRRAEAEKQALLEHTEALLAQQRVLFQEMQHRVANSLQIIANILTLKARGVALEETRQHLEDARQRVMSVATVQSHLHLTDGIDQIEMSGYLEKLCAGLAASMIINSRPVRIDVIADEGLVPSQNAISLGLIVTELVINAIKYAFPGPRPNARIFVSYEISDMNWKLTVSDNGVGRAAVSEPAKPGSGLGSIIVGALSKQLEAHVDISSTVAGMSVVITRGTFTSRIFNAA